MVKPSDAEPWCRRFPVEAVATMATIAARPNKWPFGRIKPTDCGIASKVVGHGISGTVIHSGPGLAQSRRFQYLTAQEEVLQSGVQMPQY